MQAGAGLFVVGLVAVVVSVAPAVVTGREPALPLLVVAGSLLPLGFGLALVGLLRAARTARREQRRAVRASRLSAAGQPPAPGPPAPGSSTPT